MNAGFRRGTDRHAVYAIISGIIAIGLCLSTSWAQEADRNAETSEQIQTPLSAEAQRVIDYWTPERMAAAEPENMVLAGEVETAPDAQSLVIETQNEGPVTISNMSPNGWETFDPPYRFEFEISGDTESIESVWIDMRRTYGDGWIEDRGKRGGLQRAYPLDNGKWGLALSEPISELHWSWQVVVLHTDRSWTRSDHATFLVFLPDDRSRPRAEMNARWSRPFGVDDTYHSAIGRLFYERPDDLLHQTWVGRICTGTVVTDNVTGRSLILTAGHCVYNRENEGFMRNVLFIPDQRNTSGGATDADCTNDPYGCWVPQFGVIDSRFATYARMDSEQDRDTPEHLKYSNSASLVWDFGFYVVPDSEAHRGGDPSIPEALDEAVSTYDISFETPLYDDGVSDVAWTYIFGYEQRYDPELRYCSNAITTEYLWISYNRSKSICALQAGASGGPWIYNFDESTGSGEIVSVSSVAAQFGYGVWGPKFQEASAECVFGFAQEASFDSVLQQDGQAGLMLEGDCRNWWP
jgi:hypothetical protein